MTPANLLHAVLLWAGLILLLRAFSPDHAAVRLMGVLVLEFYLFRYSIWRALDTLPPLTLAPGHLWQWTFFGVESLSIAFLCWTALVLIRRTDRSALADARERMLRDNPTKPKVTVLIPTVHEAFHVIEPTIRAAAQIDYPNFDVWVLDDDKGPKLEPGEKPRAREHAWLPELCARYGVAYLRRRGSDHAKAGNLNYGLSHTDGEILLVLDADFIAKKNILWRTVGLLDEKVALVQTPQHYYSTDPVAHNLGGDEAWVEEQRHFFDVVIPSRDAFGNAVCVGTGFVVRRSALGPQGFETACLSEDVYLGYALKSRGYQLRYLNEPLSYGAAAEDLLGYIKQRVRWCQGIIQSLCLPYGPLRAPGLSLLDRIFYLEMPFYWISQFTFLGFMLLAPLIYFWTGVPAFLASLDQAASFVLPRIIAISMIIYWISRGRVMPIVTDVKKLVGLVYILAGIVGVLLRPFDKPFDVTPKGEIREKVVVRWNVLLPFLLLALAIAVGLIRTLLGYSPVRWNEFFATNALLGLYVIALLWLVCRTCVDWPKDPCRRNLDQPLEGRWLRSLAILGLGPIARYKESRETSSAAR